MALNDLTRERLRHVSTATLCTQLFKRGFRNVFLQGIARLTQQLGALAKGGELREYVMAHYLLLYARIEGTVVLLSIRHQRQLSFDFQALWSSR